MKRWQAAARQHSAPRGDAVVEVTLGRRCGQREVFERVSDISSRVTAATTAVDQHEPTDRSG